MTNKNLFIFNYPDYVTTYYLGFAESVYNTTLLNHLCDGFTIDFLSYNQNDNYKDLPSLSNFRQLYVSLRRNLDLVNVETTGGLTKRRKSRNHKKYRQTKRRRKTNKRIKQ